MSDETAGAAPQDGDTASEDTSQDGTPEGQARNAQDEDNRGKLIGQLQEKAGKYNQIEGLMKAYGVSTIEELNERLSRSPAVADEPEPQVDIPGEDEIAEVRKWAAKGDATSKLTLKLYENNRKLEAANERLVRGIENAFTARDITDEAKRKRVVEHFQRNRGRLGDIRAAEAEVDAADLKAENQRLKDQIAAHNRNKVNPNAPSTHVADTPPAKTTTTKVMKHSEFRAEIDRLRSEDKHDEVMALQRKRRLFEIEVTPG